jgi:hypothetical protein
MKVEFEYLKEPMVLDEKVLEFLFEKGMYFFCITKEKKLKYNCKTWEYDMFFEENVDTVIIHKNITMWGHDMFRPNKNKTLIAYCILEFPENVIVHI